MPRWSYCTSFTSTFSRLAVEGQVEDVGALVQVVDQLLLRERDGDDGLLVAVDDAGDLARVAEPLVRARAEPVAGLGGDLDAFALP